MNISLFRLIAIMSGFMGLVCGFLSLLPYLDGIAFFVLICFSAVIVMGLLMKSTILRIESTAEGITIGAIIGFISYIAFSVIYLPLIIISARVFHYSPNYSIAIFASHANLFILLVISVFIAIVSATINAFTGFLVYYITELFKNMNNR